MSMHDTSTLICDYAAMPLMTAFSSVSSRIWKPLSFVTCMCCKQRRKSLTGVSSCRAFPPH